MIFRGTKEITEIFRGNKIIIQVYRGTKLVWELIKSCFGSGYWINKNKYDNNDAWKN